MIKHTRNTTLVVIAAGLGVTCMLLSIARAGDFTTDDLTVNEDATVYGKLFVPSATATNTVAPTNGLVLYYSFSTNTSPVVLDDSNNGNSGTVSNQASWTEDGKSGGAYEFDGTGDCIDAGTSNSLNIGTIHTIAAWLKLDADNNMAFGKIGASGYYSHYLASDNVYYKADGVYVNMSWDYNIPMSSFHHVVIVRTNTAVELYVDGAKSGTTQTLSANNATRVDRIGGRDGDATYDWDGIIDEVRVYNRALSAQEITNLYASTSVLSDDPGVVEFMDGVKYTAPLGGVSMGVYTNAP